MSPLCHYRLRRSGVRGIALWSCSLIVLLLAVALFPVRVSSADQNGLRRFEFQQMQMGTVFRLVLYATSAEIAAKASSEAFHRIEAIEQALSDYREDSELNRAERLASEGPFLVSKDLFRVLSWALELARATRGAYDPTVKPLALLWKSAQLKGKLPSREELSGAIDFVCYENILLNERTRSLRLRHDGVRIDLGGVGKGYAAEQAFRLLEAQGLPNVLVDAGGDLRLGIPPPGRSGWEIELDSRDLTRTFQLREVAVATSGDKYQYVELDGKRYSHIVDPRTGLGVSGARLVTVIATDAMEADGYATALSVLSPREGIALVEGRENVEARIQVEREGKVLLFRSSGFPP